MGKEILLILMPGILSMFVWRKMHGNNVFSAMDYLEGIVVFDFCVYLLNVFLIWSRNWESFELAALGCSGTFKYTASSVVAAVGIPVLINKLDQMRKK